MPFDAPVISTTRSWKFVLIFNSFGFNAAQFTGGREEFLGGSYSSTRVSRLDLPTCLNGTSSGCYARSEAFRYVKSQDEWE